MDSATQVKENVKQKYGSAARAVAKTDSIAA